MKKLLCILCLVPNLAFASYSDQVRESTTNVCFDLITEQHRDAKPEIKEEMKKFCQRVADCLVDNAPNEYILTQSAFLQQQFMFCLQKEGADLPNRYK